MAGKIATISGPLFYIIPQLLQPIVLPHQQPQVAGSAMATIHPAADSAIPQPPCC